MQVKGLIVAASVLAALGGAVWWSNRDEEAKKSLPAKDAPPKILSLSEAEIGELRFERAGLEATVVKRGKAGLWEIVAPKELAADQSAVGAVVGALGPLNSEKLVEEKSDNLASFGLVNPSASLTVVKKDGKTVKILLGDEVAIGTGTYLKVDSEPRIFTIAAKNILDKNWSDLRERRLLTFDSGKLTRLEVTTGKDVMEFSRTGTNNWTIAKPSAMRGDNFAIEELVQKLGEARMEDTPDDAAAADAIRKFYAAPLVGKVKTTDAAGASEIEVRKTKDGAHLAKSTVVTGIYKVSDALGDALKKGLEDYRNKKVFDFGFQDPTRLEIKGPGRSWVFEKSKEEWKTEGRIVQSGKLQELIDKLRELSSIKFKTEGGGSAHSEFVIATGDGKNVEKVTITKAGDSLLASRPGDAAIYELDGLKVEEILTAAAAVKDGAGKPEAKK